MSRRLLVAFTLGASALVAPAAAQAAAPDVIYGGCGFDTNSQATLTNGQNTGVIYDVSVTTTGDLVPTLIGATVSCWIEVNGAEAPGTRFSYSGDGVQYGADGISFDDGGGIYPYTECESVAFADGTTSNHCVGDENPTIPPEPVIDDINEVNDALTDAEVIYVDPVVCPVLVKLAGTYGPVTITPDGDVDIADPFALVGWVYDCPPYDKF